MKKNLSLIDSINKRVKELNTEFETKQKKLIELEQSFKTESDQLKADLIKCQGAYQTLKALQDEKKNC